MEERNHSFSTNFLFNAKELDNETGLYYYGARYLDPTGAMWLSVDPMWENNMEFLMEFLEVVRKMILLK